jgi:hypothetical protein
MVKRSNGGLWMVNAAYAKFLSGHKVGRLNLTARTPPPWNAERPLPGVAAHCVGRAAPRGGRETQLVLGHPLPDQQPLLYGTENGICGNPALRTFIRPLVGCRVSRVLCPDRVTKSND